MILNIRRTSMCAFCKYWENFANRAILPYNAEEDIWEITDVNEKNMCLLINVNTRAGDFCTKYYECKL